MIPDVSSDVVDGTFIKQAAVAKKEDMTVLSLLMSALLPLLLLLLLLLLVLILLLLLLLLLCATLIACLDITP